MKKNILIFITFFACSAIYGQGTINSNSILAKKNSFNYSTGVYNKPNNPKANNKKGNDFKLADFDSNCNTDFWTINSIGDIQQWSLVNNSITGGNIVIGGGGGLAYCGDPNSPTFYTSQYPSTGIQYYDDINGWQNIPTDVPVLNSGGHLNDQYYMGNDGSANNILYYFDGMNLTTIDYLASEYFSVADIAVDTQGRAWVFKGNTATSVTNLNVYDNAGLTLSYALTFNSTGSYGSFFLNDTLYVGMSGSSSTNPNSVTPIIITGSTAQLGMPISFTNVSFYDMASCQNNDSPTTFISELSNSDINVFPNPTIGIINFSTSVNIINIEIYNLNGKMITKSKLKSKADLTDLPNGMYIVKVITENKEYYKKIIKR
tara:strand:- start:3223 stop:4344 length:1122 start_codon:yes stop_codon:yes gene_type:complete